MMRRTFLSLLASLPFLERCAPEATAPEVYPLFADIGREETKEGFRVGRNEGRYPQFRLPPALGAATAPARAGTVEEYGDTPSYDLALRGDALPHPFFIIYDRTPGLRDSTALTRWRSVEPPMPKGPHDSIYDKNGVALTENVRVQQFERGWMVGPLPWHSAMPVPPWAVVFVFDDAGWVDWVSVGDDVPPHRDGIVGESLRAGCFMDERGKK
jgi:hypothetical protein